MWKARIRLNIDLDTVSGHVSDELINGQITFDLPIFLQSFCVGECFIPERVHTRDLDNYKAHES